MQEPERKYATERLCSEYEPKPILPIPAAINDLKNIIESLRTVISKLEERLETVLESQAKKPMPEEKTLNEGTGLASRLQNRYKDLQRLTTWLETITSRLEL